MSIGGTSTAMVTFPTGGGLDADQIEFVKNDLALVPEEKLVMLMMHIPLRDVGNRAGAFPPDREAPAPRFLCPVIPTGRPTST